MQRQPIDYQNEGPIDGNIEQNAHKPDTALEIEMDGLMSTNSTNEGSPPTIIVVETCVTKLNDLRSKMEAADAEIESPMEPSDKNNVSAVTEQPCCSFSTTLCMKPNIKFQAQPLSAASIKSTADRSLQLSLAALESSTTTAVRVDSTTQCNNIEGDTSLVCTESMPSISSLVCRICHNADNPEQLVSPCLCKGSLTYVHIHCLERWISTSRCTICELCQFQYNTEQTLRYTCLQSLRLWYSRAMSRRALQEDCQMFSLLTLVAFGIIGTLLVGIQYYSMHSQSWGLSKLWTKSWMLFFLFMTISVYLANVYMLVKSQLSPWYRWWQSARDIKLILENRRPFPNPARRIEFADAVSTTASMFTHHDQQEMRQSTVKLSTAGTLNSHLEHPSGLPQQRPIVANSTTMAVAMALEGLSAYKDCDCKAQRTPEPLPSPLNLPSTLRKAGQQEELANTADTDSDTCMQSSSRTEAALEAITLALDLADMDKNKRKDTGKNKGNKEQHGADATSKHNSTSDAV